MKSLKNIVVLLALILGGTVITTGAIFVGGVTYDRLTVPTYEAADIAIYQYIEGDEASIMVGGAVDLMVKRGYNIFIEDIPAHAAPAGEVMPRMLFFDADGNEIVENRMQGFWCIYDMKVRLGG